MKNINVSENQELLPLNKPYVELYSSLLEAELSDNPNAVNNVVAAAQALACLTLQKGDGEVVDKLEKLEHKVNQFVFQLCEMKNQALHTHDDDKVEDNWQLAKVTTERVSRIISRKIFKILWNSFKYGPLKACTTNTSETLAYSAEKEYAAAQEYVIDELLANGMYEVVEALQEGTELQTQKVQKPEATSRCPTVKQQRCPTTKHFGSVCFGGKQLGAVRR